MINPTSKTNTTLLRCYPDNIEDFEGCPETAVVTLAPELYDRIILLTAEIERLKVKSIVAATACVTFHAWNEDEEGMEILGQELLTDNHRLHVAREGIWFSGCREVSRRRFRTTVADVEQFRKDMAPEVDEVGEDLLDLQLEWAKAEEEDKAWVSTKVLEAEARSEANAAWVAETLAEKARKVLEAEARKVLEAEARSEAAKSKVAERQDRVTRNKRIWQQYRDTTNKQ